MVADWRTLDSDSGSAANASPPDAGARQSPYLIGADISWVQQEEASGVTYFDQGDELDVLEILKRHGFNAIRLRVFNDPSSPCRISATGDQTCGYQIEADRSETFCDLDHTLTMARRAKALGLQLMLDFHYSDTWADPDDQNKPLAWEKLAFADLVTALGTFTRTSLQRFVDADVAPDIVQLGNGITAGMLYPDGVSTDENWPRLAELLSAASSAVRSVIPASRVLLHIDKPDSFATASWWVQSALDNGVDFDILGQTCFPESQGPRTGWKTTFESLARAYPRLSYVIVEYSEERRAVNDIMFDLPAERGLGTFVWEPTEWRETLFDTDDKRKSTNARIQEFDRMLADYGLPAP